MTAITLQIMVNAPTYDLSYDPEKAAQRYRNGEESSYTTTDESLIDDSIPVLNP